MVCPSLISASVTPGSYFFCAWLSCGKASVIMAANSTRWIRFIRLPYLDKFSDKPTSACLWPHYRFCVDGNLLADNLAKQHPPLAIKPRQLYLLDWIEVRGAGGYPDPWEEHRNFQILQPRRLSHDVFVGKVITALLENMSHGLRSRIRVNVGAVFDVTFRIIFLHPVVPKLQGRIVCPLGI